MVSDKGADVRVVVVDDDAQFLDLIERQLRHEGIEYVLAIKAEIGTTNQIRRYKPHVVLVDLNMPHFPGEKVLALLQREVPEAFYVVLSADDPTKIRRAQLAVGADMGLSKSTPVHQIAHAIKSFEGRHKSRIPGN